MLRSTILAILALPLAAFAADPPAPGGAIALLRQLDEGFVEVFEKVAPSVVVINAMKTIEDEDREDLKGLELFFQGEKETRSETGDRPWRLPSRSEGSGFIIRPDGYILTNHHVVSGAEKITVRLKDGREFSGKVIGVDEHTDVAIVRIEAKDLPAATIGDSDRIRVGQLVCAIGAPFNQHFSFSVGWVSGKDRTNLLGPTSTNVLYEDYIQTDTFINPGNSGGPLFDVEGRVIGMNTLINGIGRGLAFAIPSSMFQEVAEQLIAHRRFQRPYVGIRMYTPGDERAARETVPGLDRGVGIETIDPGSPAYRSDLRPTDVIVEVDGVKVAAARDVQKEILKKKIGATVQLSVWRGSSKLRIPVVMGELPSKITTVANIGTGKLGIEARAESLGLKLRNAKPTGAVVTGITADSPASRAKMQSDDVIVEVEGRPVRDAAAAAAAIGDRVREAGDKAVLLHIQRKGQRLPIVITPQQ
jgi:S1-C subfamily serine protease